MGANFSRVKNWQTDDTLTSSDLNTEFNNILTNFLAAQIDDSSSNLSAMQTTVDPGETPGTDVALPTSLEGELHRLRNIITEITGKTYWYQSPSTSLSLLSSPEQNLHIGLEFEGKNAGASSTTDVLAKIINQGGIINATSLSSADVAISDFDSSNVKFGSYAYSLGSGNILAFSGTHGNPYKGTVSTWFRNLASNDYIAYNPLLGIELYCQPAAGTSVEGALTAKVTERTASTESAKETKLVEGASARTDSTSYANAILKWRCNDENGASTDLLELEYNGSDEGTQLTSQDIDINGGQGGVWFFGVQRNDPTWDHVWAASDIMSAHSDAIWTSNGTPNAAVANGSMNIATTSTNTGYYSSSTLIEMENQTLEWKMKVNTSTRVSLVDKHCSVQIRDDDVDRGIRIQFNEDSLSIIWTDTASPVHEKDIFLDTKSWHTYRMTTTAAAADGDDDVTIKLYVDGVLVYTGVNTNTHTGQTLLRVGDQSSVDGENSDFDLEYFKIYDAGAEPPVSASTQGQLDSIGVSSDVVGSATITAIQGSKITDVFNKFPSYGPTLPYIWIQGRNQAGDISSTTTLTNLNDAHDQVYYVAGDGASEFIFTGNIVCSMGDGEWANLGISVNDDLLAAGTVFDYGLVVLRNEGGSQDLRTAQPFRTARLPVGLNTIRIVGNLSAAGTVTLAEQDTQFEVSLRKIEVL